MSITVYKEGKVVYSRSKFLTPWAVSGALGLAGIFSFGGLLEEVVVEELVETVVEERSSEELERLEELKAHTKGMSPEDDLACFIEIWELERKLGLNEE